MCMKSGQEKRKDTSLTTSFSLLRNPMPWGPSCTLRKDPTPWPVPWLKSKPKSHRGRRAMQSKREPRVPSGKTKRSKPM